MKRKLFQAALYLSGTLIAGLSLIYFFQERIIFQPQKLAKEYAFQFLQPFEELNIPVDEQTTLNGLLFKTGVPKGLIIYLHGNAGSLASWGKVASTYTDLNYDVFIYDYRGYGKSEGTIKSEAQLFTDNQKVYEYLAHYNYKKTIIIGYSIGTGMAARLAATYPPDLLILQAPYYSLTDLVQHSFPVLPSFLLKYKFETYKLLNNCSFPVLLFHGDQDEVIYPHSSEKLLKVLKPADRLILLKGQGHNGITGNPDYIKTISKVLALE
ncbi:MAG: alpha/beta fold hydrolase [Sphingobacteriales bacterium]|nr:MAG: alpha/beta fold hydrolase [Sphingobacteriales bacterium]